MAGQPLLLTDGVIFSPGQAQEQIQAGLQTVGNATVGFAVFVGQDRRLGLQLVDIAGELLRGTELNQAGLPKEEAIAPGPPERVRLPNVPGLEQTTALDGLRNEDTREFEEIHIEVWKSTMARVQELDRRVLEEIRTERRKGSQTRLVLLLLFLWVVTETSVEEEVQSRSSRTRSNVSIQTGCSTKY